MDTFKYPVEIGTPDGLRYEQIMALVDTGSSHTRVSSAMLRRLGVNPLRREPFKTADERTVYREVGQTWVRIDGKAVIRMVVFGQEEEEPLLGADALEGLLLAVDPVAKRLVPTTGLMM